MHAQSLSRRARRLRQRRQTLRPKQQQPHPPKVICDLRCACLPLLFFATKAAQRSPADAAQQQAQQAVEDDIDAALAHFSQFRLCCAHFLFLRSLLTRMFYLSKDTRACQLLCKSAVS